MTAAIAHQLVLLVLLFVWPTWGTCNDDNSCGDETVTMLATHRVRYPQQPPMANFEPARYVDEVYTFAAPAVTKEAQLEDGQSSDGCFPGFRVWARSPDGHVDPVPRGVGNFQHALQSTLEFRIAESVGVVELDNFSTPLYDGTVTRNACSQDSKFLPDDWFPCLNMGKCHVDYYYFKFGAHGLPDLEFYHRLCKDTELKWSAATSVSEAQKKGYNVVGYADIRSGFAPSMDGDVVMLYQEEETHNCVLVFEGSDSLTSSFPDWVSNLNMRLDSFCGFPNCHKGFLEELQNIIQNEVFQTNIKSKLPSCAKVAVTGHSKGGAMTQLFSACANRKDLPIESAGLKDYSDVVWQKGVPTSLQPLSSW